MFNLKLPIFRRNITYSPYGSILSGGNVSRYDYEGQEYDSVVGQYDFHFRGYKAEWGKFTQPDSLIQNVYDPQSLNRYAFERGNPFNRIDPDGHQDFQAFCPGGTCFAPLLPILATYATVVVPLVVIGVVAYFGYQAYKDYRANQQSEVDLSSEFDYIYETMNVPPEIEILAESLRDYSEATKPKDVFEAGKSLIEITEDLLDDEEEENYCLDCIRVPIKDEDGNIVGYGLVFTKGQETLTWSYGGVSTLNLPVDQGGGGGGTALGGRPVCIGTAVC